MKKREPVFIIGGILVGMSASIPLITVGAVCTELYKRNWLMIPFILVALSIFMLIQIIILRKKKNSLKSFYLMSAVVSVGVILLLMWIILDIGQGFIMQLVPMLESKGGGILAMVLLYLVMIITAFVFVGVFGFITRHKSDYVKRIADRVSRIAESGEDSHIEEKGNDELTILSKSINQMNADLQENKRRQQKAEQQKNELISNVSHDLRSPLTSIVGYVQLLKKYESINDERYSEYLEVIDRRLGGLDKLINELFELTKMDSPNFSLNLERGDITAFVKQFVYEMKAVLKQSDLELTSSIDDCELITDADFERLARVMENLFANVIKYAEPNTDVILKTKTNADSIIISLSNHIREGATINTENMFERFYRNDQSRTDTGSSGLGLAIAKKIVELHGGEIKALLCDNIIKFEILLRK